MAEVTKYVEKISGELSRTGGPRYYMSKQIHTTTAPIEKDIKDEINKLLSSMKKCTTFLCRYRIKKQIKKLYKLLKKPFREDISMAAIYEDQTFTKMFILEYGDRFTDAYLLLEDEDLDLEECEEPDAAFKVTTEEEEDIEECNESDRICEDVIMEFNPDVDKKLLKGWKKGKQPKVRVKKPGGFVKTIRKGMKRIVGGSKGKPLVNPKTLSFKNLAIGTVLAAGLYSGAQTYRLLRKQGKDPVTARREQIQAIKYAMSKCNRTKNPRLCRDKFEKQIRILQGKPTL